MKRGQCLSCFDDTEYLSNFKLSPFSEVVGDSLLLCMFEKQQKMKPLKTDFFFLLFLIQSKLHNEPCCDPAGMKA